MKKIIVLFGSPGSGKGTQAKLLAEKFGYYHLSTGQLFRDLVKKNELNAEEQMIKDHISNGELVPSNLVYKIAFAEIDKRMAQYPGIILDGAVRTVEQAERYDLFFFDRGWEKEILALSLSLTDEEAMKRLSSRRVCTACGAITVLGEKCPKCGQPLTTRPDDTPEAVAVRIKKQGSGAVAPILARYESQNRLITIDASLPVPEVSKQILAVLQ